MSLWTEMAAGVSLYHAERALREVMFAECAGKSFGKSACHASHLTCGGAKLKRWSYS